jgi:TonB-dependent receptor
MMMKTCCIHGRYAIRLLVTMASLCQLVFAQGSGSIRGRVLDKKTGDPLPGANVVLQNTAIGASTDLDGNYRIRIAPSGTQILRASYLGYAAETITVTIRENQEIQQDFTLVPVALEGEEVIVTAQAQGQNAAINQQLSSNTITNVVSSARIKELPDVNAAESIGRLPGVAINRSGGEANTVNIRGLDPKYNLVTVNGIRLPSSGDDRNTALLTSVLANQSNPGGYRFGGNDRGVDLSLVASNTLDGIELKKAITPDMDADVLGGTIDLKLKEAPEGYHLNLSGQGGYNQLQNYYGNYNFSGNASNRFLDGALGVIVTGNTDHYDRSADKLNGRYIAVPRSRANTVDAFDVREEKANRERTGGNLLLDLNIPDGKVNAHVVYNRMNYDGIYRVNNFDVTQPRHYFDLEDRKGTTDIFSGSLSAKQDYGWIRFDAGVSRNGSESSSPDERGYHFSHETGGVYNYGSYQVDSTTTPLEIPVYATNDTGKTLFAEAYRFDTKRNEYQTTAQLNVSAPFRLGDFVSGYVKGGGKFRQLSRRNDEEVYGISGLQYGGGLNQLTALARTLSILYPNDWDYLRDSAYIRVNNGLPIGRFLYDYSRTNFLDGEYPIGLTIDPAKVDQLMEAMILTPVAYERRTIASLGRDYDGVERYQAAYLMAEFSIGGYVRVLPGIRWEKDYSTYHGQRYKEVITGGNTQGPPADYSPITSERKNQFWLPMVHVSADPLEWLKLRFAFTKTLTRPDFNLYAPITFINSLQTQIVAANSNLRPSISRNFDVSASVFDQYVGLFTVSGFYKEIEGLIFSSQYNILPGQGLGPPPGSNIPDSWLFGAGGAVFSPTIYSYPMNNLTPAYVRGIELEWQTHFWYLPSFLQGLVLNVNYTRIGSSVDIHFFTRHDSLIRLIPPLRRSTLIDTSVTSRVPGQPSDLLNVTLGYDYGGFSVRLSYLFQSDRVSSINVTNASLSSFTTSYSRWDLSLSQRLFDWGLQVFANLANLNARRDESTLDYQFYHPTSIQSYGFTMDVGVRFQL